MAYYESMLAAVRDKKDILVIVVAVLVALGIIWWRSRTQDETEDIA